jgi:brefeldin A-resistance guanine nucleotide exchange factor 1
MEYKESKQTVSTSTNPLTFMNTVGIVLGEIQNVLTAMRLNARWSTKTRQKYGSESSLLTNLVSLRTKLEASLSKDIRSFDILEYLQPFLDIILSEETSGPITGVALSAVNKFIKYGFIQEDSPNASLAMRNIADAVTRCRFEATDPDTDEVVLMKIQRVLLALLESPQGHLLSDQIINDMIQTCFKMSIQTRLSVLLRKSAEMTLIEMVRRIFTNYDPSRRNKFKGSHSTPKLHTALSSSETHFTHSTGLSTVTTSSPPTTDNNTNNSEKADNSHNKNEAMISCPPEKELPPTTDTGNEDNDSESDNEEVAVDPNSPPSVRSSTTSTALTSSDVQKGVPQSSSSPSLATVTALAQSPLTEQNFVNPQGVRFQLEDEQEKQELRLPHKPYGVHGLVRLFRFLCSIINPKDINNTESMQFLGLALINTIIEVRAKSLQNIPKLMTVIKDDLCRYLLQSLQTENVSILTMALRVFFNLFSSLKRHLKFQMELFFNEILGLLSNKEIPFEHREVVLEIIVQLCKDSTFLVDLYINYDCDLQCSNLFERLVEFLYKRAFPTQGQITGMHLLSLEGLLSIVNTIADRINSAIPPAEPPVTVEYLQEQKQLKNTLIAGADIFNQSPEECFQYLQERKILPTPLDAVSVAEFLRRTPFLNKKKIGEYLGSPKAFNQEVLLAYCKTFEVNGVRILPALRNFLESFRMPTEGQIVTRILTAFSKDYYERISTSDDTFSNEDAVLVLALSIAFLNVDQHSPKIKGERMTLEQFISSLRGQNGDRDFPQELLIDIYNNVKDNEIRIPEEHIHEEISQVTWHYLLKKYNNIKDIGEYREVSLAAKYYDKMIYTLIWRQVHAALKEVFTATQDEELIAQTAAHFHLCGNIAACFQLTDAFYNLIYTLCEASTILSSSSEKFLHRFSADKKAHIATVSLFTLARKHGDLLREGWKNILVCLIRLHSLDVLPTLTEIEDIFHVKPSKIRVQQRIPEPSIGRLLSEGYNLLFGSEQTPKSESAHQSEPKEQKYRQRVRTALQECAFKELIQSSKYLKQESLTYLIKALILGCSPNKSSKKFDEVTATFCLDILSYICLLNDYRLSTFWPLVSEHFEQLLSSLSSNNTQLLVSHAVINLLYLGYRLLEVSDITERMLQSLLVLTRLNSDVEKAMLRKIAVGFRKIIKKNAFFIRSKTSWEYTFLLIKFTTNSPLTIEDGFKILCHLITPQPSKPRMVQPADSQQQLATLPQSPRSSQPLPETFVTPENFSLILELVSCFTKSEHSPLALAMKSTELFLTLHSLVAKLLKVSPNSNAPFFPVQSLANSSVPHDNLNTAVISSATSYHSADEKKALLHYWIPVLQQLSSLCRDRRWEIQNRAIMILQRALLLEHLKLVSPDGWSLIFEQVIFPLLNELLKGSDNSDLMNKDNTEEIRMRASSILCKTFLQYLPTIVRSPDFKPLWLKILRFIEMYMKAENSETLAEAITEALKNILLVMFASEIFRPPDSSLLAPISNVPNSNNNSIQSPLDLNAQHELWDLSWKTIDKFCPQLRHDFLIKIAPKTNDSKTSSSFTGTLSQSFDKTLANANAVNNVSAENMASLSTAAAITISGGTHNNKNDTQIAPLPNTTETVGSK